MLTVTIWERPPRHLAASPSSRRRFGRLPVARIYILVRSPSGASKTLAIKKLPVMPEDLVSIVANCVAPLKAFAPSLSEAEVTEHMTALTGRLRERFAPASTDTTTVATTACAEPRWSPGRSGR